MLKQKPELLATKDNRGTRGISNKQNPEGSRGMHRNQTLTNFSPLPRSEGEVGRDRLKDNKMHATHHNMLVFTEVEMLHPRSLQPCSDPVYWPR